MNPFVDIITMIRSQTQSNQTNGLCLGQLTGLEPLAITYLGTQLNLPVTLPQGTDMAVVKGNERCIFLLDQEELLVLALY